jgi:protein gp37
MKRPRLSKSGIEYLDYTWNFYSGCRNWEQRICEVGKNCWARDTTTRFPNHYPNGFEPTFYPEAFLSPLYLKKPSRIGVAFMGDLFGDWNSPDLIVEVTDDEGRVFARDRLKDLLFAIITKCSQHTFIFLTKCPWNYKAWSPFPPNCQVGATATETRRALSTCLKLADVPSVRLLSLEPMFRSINLPAELLKTCGINQVIIGAQTQPYIPPKIEWVQYVVRAADEAGAKVFLKDNIGKLIADNFMKAPSLYGDLMEKKDGVFTGRIRQEIPK